MRKAGVRTKTVERTTRKRNGGRSARAPSFSFEGEGRKGRGRVSEKGISPVVGLLEWKVEMEREGLFDLGKEVDVEEREST